MKGIHYPNNIFLKKVSPPLEPSVGSDSIEMYEQSSVDISIEIESDKDIRAFCNLGSVKFDRNKITYISPTTGDNDSINDIIYVYKLSSDKVVGTFKGIDVLINRIPAISDDLISNDDFNANALLIQNLE